MANDGTKRERNRDGFSHSTSFARGTRRGPWWLPGMEARRLLPEMEEERLPERCRLALLSAPRLAGRAGALRQSHSDPSS